MNTVDFLLPAIAILIGADLAIGFALRQFYRRWNPGRSEAMPTWKLADRFTHD